MKRKLMELLACPICKSERLELHVFEETEEIDAALIVCPDCDRWYPVIDGIP
ncbi:MAG: Trm112 family protein [Candidatus Heimdallarchaeota archaeon]